VTSARFHPKKSLKTNIILHLFIYFKDDLARIGYILYMKIEKKKKTRIVLSSWLPTFGTYYKNLAVWILFFTKSGIIQAIFSMKNPLSHIF
jgi:hypothetical protein